MRHVWFSYNCWICHRTFFEALFPLFLEMLRTWVFCESRPALALEVESSLLLNCTQLSFLSTVEVRRGVQLAVNLGIFTSLKFSHSSFVFPLGMYPTMCCVAIYPRNWIVYGLSLSCKNQTSRVSALKLQRAHFYPDLWIWIRYVCRAYFIPYFYLIITTGLTDGVYIVEMFQTMSWKVLCRKGECSLPSVPPRK